MFPYPQQGVGGIPNPQIGNYNPLQNQGFHGFPPQNQNK